MLRFVVAVFVVAAAWTSADAKTIAESDARQALRACGAGVKAEVRSSFDTAFDATVSKTEGEGEANIDNFGLNLQRTLDRLTDEKLIVETLRLYYECIKPKMDAFPDVEVGEAEQNFQDGAVFVLTVGATASFLDGDHTLTVNRVRFSRDKKTVWKVPSTINSNGSMRFPQFEAGESVGLKGTNCHVRLLSVDSSNLRFKFRLGCA